MALVMGSTKSAKSFYKQTFELKISGKSDFIYTLIVNPEDMQMDEPPRSSVTQTLGGAFVTDFGQGLPSVVISGTTGYRQRTNTEGKQTDGYDAFVQFREKIYRKFVKTNDPKMELFWYNWEDNEYYKVQPMSFRLMRNKSEPLLYRYEFRFTCLQKLSGSKKKPEDTLFDPTASTAKAKLSSRISNMSEFLNALQ